MFKYYNRCSKILNTSCLPKRPRQTVQTKIILLLKKQSDYGLPSTRLAFLTTILLIPTLITAILFEKKKSKMLKFLEHFNIFIQDLNFDEESMHNIT